jgi:hypothetical protein
MNELSITASVLKSYAEETLTEKSSETTALIGATGAIGKNVSAALRQQGRRYRVRCCDCSASLKIIIEPAGSWRFDELPVNQSAPCGHVFQAYGAG